MAILELQPADLDQYLEETYPQLSLLVKEWDSKVERMKHHQNTTSSPTCTFDASTKNALKELSKNQDTSRVHLSSSSSPIKMETIRINVKRITSNHRAKEYEKFKEQVLRGLKFTQRPVLKKYKNSYRSLALCCVNNEEFYK